MIELTGICKTFVVGDQPVVALDHVDLSLAPGDYLSVMGPSGSGKSTLLNILGLLDRPDDGHYRLAGSETADLPERERAQMRSRYLGFVFQAYHLVPRLSARENIELPLMLAGMPAKQRRQLSTATLERLAIADRAGHLPRQLSGGQRQRVAIARAIVRKPALLLADEPTGNLDSRAGQEVVNLLEELNAEGITLCLVTHDPELGARADRRITMVDGHIATTTRRSAHADH